MSALKNMEATVKEKVENAFVKIDERQANAKSAVEEKVEKLKANGDENAKAEAAERRGEKVEEAGRGAAERLKQNEAEKERATGPHPGPIGDRPTPADLGMSEENPYNPNLAVGAIPGPNIPNFVGPYGSSTA